MQMKNFDIDVVLTEIFENPTPDREMIEIDYGVSIAQEIIKHFKQLGSKGTPKKIRPSEGEYVWNKKERDIILKATENLPRKVVAVPCVIENGYVECWEIQFEDIINYNKTRAATKINSTY